MGRTGFGKRQEAFPVAGELRSFAVLDGKSEIGGVTTTAPCTAFPVACAEEITAADPVVKALSDACEAWIARPDARRLRAALIVVLSLLD